MAKTVKPEQLGKAIEQELKLYSENVEKAVYTAGEKAIKRLVKKTKATAPMDRPKYKKQITSKSEKKRVGEGVHTWFVRSPEHRLTHLLVKGHATKDGGHTRGNPFLQAALADVLPQYEKDVEEAVKNG